jgi:hypothetical protein
LLKKKDSSTQKFYIINVVSIYFYKKLAFYFIFIYLFAVTPIWVKAKYNVHTFIQNK